MLDILPDDELTAVVEDLADKASFYEPSVTPLVSLQLDAGVGLMVGLVPHRTE